jgi:hypothetical protein
MPMLSCAVQLACRVPLIVLPLVGLVIVSVGAVRSRVICTVQVNTIALTRLVNVVLRVFSHSPVVRSIEPVVVALTVHAKVHCVLPCIVYHAGSLTYMSPSTSGLLVYSDGNCSRALNAPVFWFVVDVAIIAAMPPSGSKINPLAFRVV